MAMSCELDAIVPVTPFGPIALTLMGASLANAMLVVEGYLAPSCRARLNAVRIPGRLEGAESGLRMPTNSASPGGRGRGSSLTLAARGLLHDLLHFQLREPTDPAAPHSLRASWLWERLSVSSTSSVPSPLNRHRDEDWSDRSTAPSPSSASVLERPSGGGVFEARSSPTSPNILGSVFELELDDNLDVHADTLGSPEPLGSQIAPAASSYSSPPRHPPPSAKTEDEGCGAGQLHDTAGSLEPASASPESTGSEYTGSWTTAGDVTGGDAPDVEEGRASEVIADVVAL